MALLEPPGETGDDASDGNSRVWIILFGALFLFLAGHFYKGMNSPWVENDTYYGAIYSQAAHNNLRAGLAVTAGVPATLYFGELPIPPDAYYVHHPTLLPLLVTASFALFGEAEWSARVTPALSSLLSLVFLWLFLRDILNRRAATLAAAVFSFLPMELHYGDMVDFEPCLLMLMLAALLFTRYWLARKSRVSMWLAGGACILAFWMDWPGYLFSISMAAWFLITGDRRQRFFAVAILCAGLLSGTVFLIQIRHANPEAWRDLWAALKMRLGNGTATGSSPSEMSRSTHFTTGQWITVVAGGIYEDYLPLPLLLAVAGLIHLLRHKARHRRLGWIAWGLLLMGTAGTLYVTLLRNESFIHDFTTFYLMAVVAVLAGLGMESLFWPRLAAPHRLRWITASKGLILSILLLTIARAGYSQADRMRSLFPILNGTCQEPFTLVPDLGKRLAREFRSGTTVLCNFDPYYSVLPYYAQRELLNNLTTPGEWKDAVKAGEGLIGGVIWTGSKEAVEVVHSLPAGDLTPLDVDGIHFVLWHPRGIGSP